MTTITTQQPKTKLIMIKRCPPCKTFSPKLIQFYNTVNNNSNNTTTTNKTTKDNLEIIYISSDRDASSFNDYYGKMPWLAAMPACGDHDARDRAGKLAEMFKIQVSGTTLPT